MASSKSGRLSNTRIVETNSSGIVTIVIDDDCEPVVNTIDTNDTNPSDTYFFSSSAPNRRPIGVRTPVPTPGSPKFINSENSQNLLIKENKNNVIVVSSGSSGGLSSPPFRSGQTSFSSSSSCCSPQSLASEVISHHNIVSKQQTHYVVLNKPKPSANSTSTTTSSHTSSPSSPSFANKSSPTKLRLWTHPTSQSAPRSPPVVVSTTTRSRSHTSLPPEDVESDCMDDQTFFQYLNLIPNEKFENESKLELKTNWPLRKVSKIPKPDTNSDGKLLLANFKLIREPIRSAPDITPQLSERKLRWYREAQHYNERLQKFKANLPMNIAIRERIQSDLEKLHKRLMSDKQRLNVDEEKFRRMKSSEQNQRLQKEELRQELDSYTNAFEMSSLMGRRVMISSDSSSLSIIQIFGLNMKIDSFCNQKDILSVTVPQNTKLSTRITRSNTAFAGIDKMWGPRSESHQYCFTRRQRLDKYRRLETGLNWKSRLMAMQCRPIDVEVAKISRCPCCLEVVEPQWGHSCRDSDEESIAAEISSINDSDCGHQSEHNFNDEEVVSTNSELITTGNVLCFECGKEDCIGNCIDVSQTITQISITEPLVASPVPTPVVVFSSPEPLLPVKLEIEDKIMVQKVPILIDKSNNKNNIIINNNINRKSDSNSVKRLNEQNLRINSDKTIDANLESEEDIVIISEVRKDNRSQTQPKRTAEPVMITRFLAPDSDEKPSIKRKFCDKRLRSQTRSNSEEIIVKKIK